MEKNILAIAGKPGLFLLVSRGRNTLIVKALDGTKKRQPVSFRDKITSLNDVTMYTTGEDTPLMQVFENVKQAYEGKEVPLSPKQASKEELEAFMLKALPDYDADRVYQNDIRKVITWYNILVHNGITDFVTPEEKPEEKKD